MAFFKPKNKHISIKTPVFYAEIFSFAPVCAKILQNGDNNCIIRL